MAKHRFTVSAARRMHILEGDSYGGGHGPGRRKAGKSEFPATLSDDQIIEGVEAIANDASRYSGGSIPRVGLRAIAEGLILSVRTRVIVTPRVDEVITAYPLGVPRNP